MMIMQLSGLSKSFGATDILANITLEIKSSDRIAIVGRNGSGKSTLLKIMANEISYDQGEIFKRKDLTIGYLPQHTSLESKDTVWNEMRGVFQHLIDQELQIRNLEKKMQQSASLNQATYDHLLKDYDKLLLSFEKNGGYHYEANIKTVLSGLDFSEDDYHTPISNFSGGQKTRLALGKLLLQQPDLLILDEPTNHLDIQTLSWLESYLNNYTGAIVIVSHDRYFLDKIVNVIYEIQNKQSKRYVGSYSKYLQQKEQDYHIQLKQFEQQQTEIKRMEEFVERNIARASTTKRAQSRRKQLERMEIIDSPTGDGPSVKYSFQVRKRSGNDVLKINDLSFKYSENEKPLFSQIDLTLNRGDRLALIGPNGVGKTTLLKVLQGKLQHDSGTVQLGTNVEIAYYDQEQSDLTLSKTVLAELWDEYPHMDEREIRTVLGNFLFSGDDVLQHVHSLSGGEKARLALAKLMLTKANLLILDEPTNHLDIDSKEVLENALKDYPGTIIFVSHDRYFINKIANYVAEMNTSGLIMYLGDYDYYIQKKREEEERAKLLKAKVATKEATTQKSQFQIDKEIQRQERRIQREIAQIEEQIFNLETEIDHMEEKMTLPEVFQDHEKALEYSETVEQLKAEVNQLMEKWTLLHE